MLKIRKAIPSDVSSIAHFQLEMALETESLVLDREILTSGIKAVFESPEKGSYFIAEMDGITAGSLLITYEWSDWRCKTIFWIQSVYVLPAFRRQGIYAALYNHIRQLAGAQNEVGGIRLYVDKSNLTAQKTYNAMGMNGEHYQVYEWMKDF